MNGDVEGQNGKYIDSVDPEDPEYIRQHRRPAEVKEDIRLMDDRKRVSVSMGCEPFRDELENIVDDQCKQGPNPASLLALQQLSELLIPQARLNQSSMYGRTKFSTPIIPVADIRGTDSINYTKGEKILRCKLASLYRLIDLFGWSQGIYNHISVRINREEEHFLINPFGLMYHEITAASLLKINMQGDIVDNGNTVLGVNKSGFLIHGAVHAARPDIRCIIHLHTAAAAAVSSMKCGLLPISQEAAICGQISYHDYEGIVVTEEEKDKLARNLGPINKVLILRNHGVLCLGETVDEAFHYTTNFMAACETQIRLAPLGLDNLVKIDEEAQKQTFQVGSKGGGGVNTGGDGIKWRVGELEFEAHMRVLDNSGFRTGHIYRQPMIRRPRPQRERMASEVEVPPFSSSFTQMYDDETGSPIKDAKEKAKKIHKQHWINSPSAYTKHEVSEVGTDTPMKYAKWVKDESAKPPQPIATEDPNYFCPQGDNPKELKEQTKLIKKGYYESKKSAGPESKVLTGVTWDEAARMKDAEKSGTTDTVVVVGAVSKGIIKREHQHNATVYKQTYAQNPFDNMTPDEIDAYKAEVDRKQRGEGDGGLDESTEQPSLNETPVRRQPVETSVDDILPEPTQTTPARRSGRLSSSKETNIDDVLDDPSATSTPAVRPVAPIKRSNSLEIQQNKEVVEELKERNFERSKSERKPKDERAAINGDDLPSPTKSDTMRSTDSGELLDSREGSPAKDISTESPSKTDKKKKKKFRMPSFSKTKKEKEPKRKAKESGV